MASFLFVVVFASLFGGVLGILVRSSITSQRRDTIAGVTLLCLAGGATMLGLALGAAPWLLPALAVSLAAALLIAQAYAHFHRRTVSDLQKFAPALRDFGLDNFDRLDGDRDGLITLTDLVVIDSRKDLTAGDREMIRSMRRLLPQVGHCIDYTVIIGTLGGPATPVYHYGISRADLEKFPAKAQSEFDEEFGRR